ncbi:MAG: adenosyl-hopene transferase HpnH [Candidatus Bipolaricaulota bacterium]
MGRPWDMNWELSRHLWSVHRRMRRGQLTPIVLMLEPLEACNLRCVGCGRVREYADHMDARMPANEALEIAREADAPVVSLSGGEPLLHPQLGEMVGGLVEDRRWVFLCTNGLLLGEQLDSLPNDRRLCLVVHLDGTEQVHDQVTGQEGAYRKAEDGISEAVRRGFRVATNTTVFHGSDVGDLRGLFGRLSELGVEGMMISPGYAYEAVPERELFLNRTESQRVFRELFDGGNLRLPLYDNPLFLDFLKGKREYPCSAWAVPTRTVLGWRLPCYLIADRHTDDLGEILQPEIWESYGPGNDPRCAGCMLHSGFEPASALDAAVHPWKLLTRRVKQ